MKNEIIEPEGKQLKPQLFHGNKSLKEIITVVLGIDVIIHVHEAYNGWKQGHYNFQDRSLDCGE